MKVQGLVKFSFIFLFFGVFFHDHEGHFKVKKKKKKRKISSHSGQDDQGHLDQLSLSLPRVYNQNKKGSANCVRAITHKTSQNSKQTPRLPGTQIQIRALARDRHHHHHHHLPTLLTAK
jgi:hypothetical protein